MKTYCAKQEDIKLNWHLIDAQDKVLGRLASKAAVLLMGKHKPTYTPHVKSGDGVVIINAAKVRVTGDKLKDKTYRHWSGYPGGLSEIVLKDLLVKKPTEAVRHAIKGMIPKGRLGRDMLGMLKVYAGPEHPHAAQTPKEFKL